MAQKESKAQFFENISFGFSGEMDYVLGLEYNYLKTELYSTPGVKEFEGKDYGYIAGLFFKPTMIFEVFYKDITFDNQIIYLNHILQNITHSYSMQMYGLGVRYFINNNIYLRLGYGLFEHQTRSIQDNGTLHQNTLTLEEGGLYIGPGLLFTFFGFIDLYGDYLFTKTLDNEIVIHSLQAGVLLRF